VSVAFVFTGGGSHGAIQVGMLLALEEKGITPDLVIGTSVGAINAAFIAGRPYGGAARELADVWNGLQRSDVFPASPLRGISGIFGRSDHLVNPKPLRRLLERVISFERLEDAPIETRCIATDLLSGQPVELTSGNAVDAIVASSALPGLLPPIEISGRLLIDGGVSNNVPISNAVQAGATTVYVLSAGHACSPSQQIRGALHVLLHSMSVMIHDRLATQAVLHGDSVDLRVFPILCPVETSIVDFSKSSELIERSYAQSIGWLSGGTEGDGSVRSTLHHHA
jgi:NTE family protein